MAFCIFYLMSPEWSSGREKITQCKLACCGKETVLSWAPSRACWHRQCFTVLWKLAWAWVFEPPAAGALSSLCRLLSLQISLELRYLSWGIEPPQPMYSWKFTHCHPKTHEYLGLLSTRFSIGIIPQGQPQDFYHLKEEGWYCELVRDSCEGKATTSLLSSFRYKFQPLLSCFLSVVTEETNYMWQVDELIL